MFIPKRIVLLCGGICLALAAFELVDVFFLAPYSTLGRLYSFATFGPCLTDRRATAFLALFVRFSIPNVFLASLSLVCLAVGQTELEAFILHGWMADSFLLSLLSSVLLGSCMTGSLVDEQLGNLFFLWGIDWDLIYTRC